jgi:methionine biosynthesis protein MetW
MNMPTAKQLHVKPLLFKQLLKAILPGRVYKRMALFKYWCCRYFKLLFGYHEFSVDNNYNDYWRKRLGVSSYTLHSKRREKKFETIAKLIGPSCSVVDFGCGDGMLLQMLREKNRARELLGLDISDVALSACRNKGLQAKRIDVFDEESVMALGDYDYLVMSDSIEHLSNPESALALLSRKINKSIIISIPNSGFIIHRLRLLFGKSPMQWSTGESMGVHLRFWTYRDFKWWAGKMGFDITTFVPVRGVPLLKKIWPNMFSEIMIFSLQDKTGK